MKSRQVRLHILDSLNEPVTWTEEIAKLWAIADDGGTLTRLQQNQLKSAIAQLKRKVAA